MVKDTKDTTLPWEWNTMSDIMKDESHALSTSGTGVMKPSEDLQTMNNVLKRATELIKIEEATDPREIVNALRQHFVINRIEKANKVEQVKGMVLEQLMNKLESGEVPVNQLLRILNELSNTSQQDMSVLMGAPNPNAKGGGTSVNVFAGGSGAGLIDSLGPKSADTQQPVEKPALGSSDLTRLFEVVNLVKNNASAGAIDITPTDKN